MTGLDLDDEFGYVHDSVGATPSKEPEEGDSRPQWMKQVLSAALAWMKILPESIKPLKRTVENIKDPMYRFFEREVNHGAKLLIDVRRDVHDVIMICQGQKKQTNFHRQLTTNLSKGILPENWKRYTVPQGVTVIQWITDFIERVKQLQTIGEIVAEYGPKGLRDMHTSMGCLFNPEAYLTATRQYVAQSNSWSLEELELQVLCKAKAEEVKLDNVTFCVTGLKVVGATSVKDNILALSGDVWSELPFTLLQWVHISKKSSNADEEINLPVYLHPNRKNLLFTLNFRSADKAASNVYYERGVAVVCTTSLG